VTDALDDLWVRLGEPESVEDLARRFPNHVPSGSLAKLTAMKAGEVPPGSDPVQVARILMSDSITSVSCWGQCTVFASLASRIPGVEGVGVIGMKRVDARSKPVDIHAAVLFWLDGTEYLHDPIFQVVPTSTNGDVRVAAGVCIEVVPGRRLQTIITRMDMPGILRYRQFTDHLEADEIEMFCRISVTHSGVAMTPGLWMRVGDLVVKADAMPDSGFRLTVKETEFGSMEIRQRFEAWHDSWAGIGDLIPSIAEALS
jgi:hypothetical protein